MEITISLDVSNTEILGVFGKGIHLLTHGYSEDESEKEEPNDFECILVVPERIYLQEWKKWIKGKKEYCERNNYYCGVMGYVYPDNPILIGKQTINRYNEEQSQYEKVQLDVYKADIFTGNPDFEHG
jgi:hypothetical protein